MSTHPTPYDNVGPSSSRAPSQQRSPEGRTMNRQGKRQRVVTSDAILKNALWDPDFRALCNVHQRGIFGPDFEHNLLQITPTTDPQISTAVNFDEQSAPVNKLSPQQFLLSEQLNKEAGNPEVAAQRQETLLEWFDRSVEKELKKRRASMDGGGEVSPKQIEEPASLNTFPSMVDRLAEASASRVEIASQMLKVPETELTDAVEKLAKAEAMCAFADAVRIAEAAAKAAPPGQAEEAAVASVKGLQTDVKTTNIIRETLPGSRPIEVLGYVGVTHPKLPKKS